MRPRCAEVPAERVVHRVVVVDIKRPTPRALDASIRDQLALTLPSTVHIDTDGLDPARSNMIGAAGGFPDALIAITASFDSQNVTIRHVPSSARKRDDSMNPAGSSASVTSFQAERRSSSLVASTEPSTIVTNIEIPPESWPNQAQYEAARRQYATPARPRLLTDNGIGVSFGDAVGGRWGDEAASECLRGQTPGEGGDPTETGSQSGCREEEDP
jgi:hypothetical protein